MVDLQSYLNQCKDSVGGVSKVFISTFKEGQRIGKLVQNGELISSLASDWYTLRVLGGASFTETGSEGKYDQTLSFAIPKIANFEIQKLELVTLSAVALDNNGKYLHIGLFNGLTAKINKQTGGSKQELNGYQITLTGVESIGAPYSNDLTLLTPFQVREINEFYPVNTI